MFEASDFHAAYEDALPEHKQELKTANTAMMPLLGVTPALDKISDVTNEFCTDWPKIRGFLNFAIGLSSIFFPSVAPMAKAVVTAIDTTLVPSVCAKK